MRIVNCGEFIEVIGHCENEIQCAKLTLLANLYAVEHHEGYAKFRSEDINKLKYINDELEFIKFWYIYVNDDQGNTIYFRPADTPAASNKANLGPYQDGKTIQISFTNSHLVVNGVEYLLSLYKSPLQPDLDDVYQIQLSDGTTYNIGDVFNFTITSNDTLTIVRGSPHALTYFTEHGTAPSPKFDISTLSAEDLPTITAEGYSFTGWYYDNGFTTEAKVGDKLTADTTLYAKWIKQTNSVCILNNKPLKLNEIFLGIKSTPPTPNNR